MAHSFIKVQREGEQMTIWPLKDEFLVAGLRDKSIALEYADLSEDEVLLTAPTAELIKYFSANAANVRLFDDPLRLKRGGKTAGAEPSP